MPKIGSENNPAGIISVAVAGCENNGDDKLCELDTFQKKVAKVIEPACHI